MGARDELVFDQPSHTYRLAGRLLPSVTQVLAPLVDFSRVPPDVLEAKRDLGSRVHETCHFHDEDDDVLPYLEGWKRFMRESGARILQCETRVCEPVLGYAGSLDRVLELNGNRWLVDLKTSFCLPHTVGAQTAAYLRALADPSVTHRGALRLRADGTYRLDALTGAADWSVFMACLTIARFKAAHP